MKKNMIVLIILLLICSHIYFAFGFIQRGNVIDDFFNSTISLSKHHIANSYNSMNYFFKTDDDNSKIVYLTEVQRELDSARSAIRMYTIYYNYKYNDGSFYIGNGYATDFFESYQNAARYWSNAFQENDLENIPNEAELNNYLDDLKTLTNEFQVYANVDYFDKIPIEELQIKELNNLLIQLAKNTKTERVYNELKIRAMFSKHLNN